MTKLIAILTLLSIAPYATLAGCPERTFIINNHCDFTIWAAEVGDGWEMRPGESITVCHDNSWSSGRFWARTNCRFGSNGQCYPSSTPCCDSGDCIDSSGAFGLKCKGAGTPPATLAEFTLIPFGQPPYVDYYDVSNVDGSNVPVQIIPIGGTFGEDPSPRIVTHGGHHIECRSDLECQSHRYGSICDMQTKICVDDTPSTTGYYCGTPGCTPATCRDTSLGTCDWEFNPGIYETQLRYVHVAQCNSSAPCKQCINNQYCRCNSNADCPHGTECGQDLIPGIGVEQVCGRMSGWQTPKQLCALDPNIPVPIGCSLPVPGQGTRNDLYQCIGPNGGSCYSKQAGSKCCGCPSWSIPGTCQNNNGYWNQYASGPIGVFKKACPTAYSFPYDDLTSTFTCKGRDAQIQPGYNITFCPR